MSLATTLSLAVAATLTISVSTTVVEGGEQTVIAKVHTVSSECPDSQKASGAPMLPPEVFQRSKKKEAPSDSGDNSFCGASMGPLGEETNCQYDMVA